MKMSQLGKQTQKCNFKWNKIGVAHETHNYEKECD
jgi:hypothetical protein